MIIETLSNRLLKKRKIESSPDNKYNDCWIWTGDQVCKNIEGRNYGIILIDGKRRRVHRVSASLWLGFDLESKLDVCHKCDNPPCFNPDHLFVGTRSDNIKDMWNKGNRYALG